MKRRLALTALGAVGSIVLLTAQNMPTPGFPPIYTPETETTNWVAQVVTNGGTVSAYQQWYVNRSIKAAKDNSLWTLIDDVYALCAENSVQALTSWKGLRLATAVSSPTTPSKQGAGFNGTSYIDSGFVPSTMGVALTGTSIHLGLYFSGSNAQNSNRMVGARGADTTQELSIIDRNTSDALELHLLNSATSATIASFTDRRGYISGTKSAGVYTGYRNGASLGTISPTGTSTTLPAVAMAFGALNNNGTIQDQITASGLCLADIGGAMDATQEGIWYDKVVLPYMKAMGVFTP